MARYECQDEDCEFSASFRGISIHMTVKHGKDFDKSPHLIKELRRLEEDIGRTPTKKEASKHGKYGVGTYQKTFGSWNKALEASGIEETREKDISKEAILEEIRRVDSKCGKCTYKTMKREGKYSPDVCRNKFGSFEKAKEIADVESYKAVEKTKEELKEEIEKVAKEIGGTPTLSDMKKSNVSPNCYYKKFGSWNDALRKCGYEPNYTGEERGSEHPAWTGGTKYYYGADWYEKREQALERADFVCEYPGCEKEKSKYRGLECHHIIPNKLTEDYQKHDMENLLILCNEHHNELKLPKRCKTESEHLI